MSGGPSLMPEEEGIPNTRGSCTVDEAVARLLGWFKSPVSKRYIQVSEHGVSIDQMPFLTTFYDSLDQTLYELRESARAALLDAAESSDGYESLQAKEHAVKEMDRLISTARVYRLEIEDAAYRPDSPFVVNRDLTTKTGVTHFTLVSFDVWARKKFGKSLFDSSFDLSDQSQARQEYADGSGPDDIDFDSTTTRGQSYQSALVTMALMVEKLATTASGLKKGDVPNELAIAKAVALAAKTKGRSRGRGQSMEAIRKRLEAARKALAIWGTES